MTGTSVVPCCSPVSSTAALRSSAYSCSPWRCQAPTRPPSCDWAATATAAASAPWSKTPAAAASGAGPGGGAGTPPSARCCDVCATWWESHRSRRGRGRPALRPVTNGSGGPAGNYHSGCCLWGWQIKPSQTSRTAEVTFFRKEFEQKLGTMQIFTCLRESILVLSMMVEHLPCSAPFIHLTRFVSSKNV